MKFPIVAYGDPVLKKVCVDIESTYPDLQQLISNMFETMNNASGVGLAAPQVGLPIRLFIVDTKADEKEEVFKKVFINAKICRLADLIASYCFQHTPAYFSVLNYMFCYQDLTRPNQFKGGKFQTQMCMHLTRVVV